MTILFFFSKHISHQIKLIVIANINQVSSFLKQQLTKKTNDCLSHHSHISSHICHTLEPRFSTSMATVQLESFSLIPSSQHPRTVASSLSCRPIAARFPPYTGLKLRPLAATSLRSRFAASRVVPRGGRVLCEARDTAVEG